MLTTSQTAVVGAITPYGVTCLECAIEIANDDLEGVQIDSADGLRVWLACHMPDYGPIIEYSLHAEYNSEGYGVWCDFCRDEMAPPYCTECGDELTDENWSNPEVQVEKYDRLICDACWVG